MLLHAIDRVIKTLQRPLFPDLRLRPRGRPSGCSPWAAAEVWCFPTTVESLEQRTLLSGIAVQTAKAPVANDDSASTAPDAAVTIDVLANDFDPDGTLNLSSLAISSGPTHGTVALQQTILDLNDDGSPVGNGLGSALSGVVGQDGRITLAVSGTGDFGFTGAHQQSGDFALFVRLGESDFSNFDPGVFDFRFTGSLTPGEAEPFSRFGLTPGTSFVAWIDNTVGSVAPDTLLGLMGPNVVVYTPDPGAVQRLVVDDPRDVNDGNYSPGHLSLREAVLLANAGHRDVFRYTVRDNAGLLSRQATVTVEVTDATTIITFAPRLTARGPVTLSPSLVGDNTAGNSAFAITSDITIIGPAGRRGVTLKGTGSSGDLRLFRVLAGGNLTLQGLTMTNWSTDTNGGVLAVDPSGIVSLTDCTLSNNSALSQGGAIFSLSEYLGNLVEVPRHLGVTVTNCTLSGNRAHDGGAYNGGGQTYGTHARFTDCNFTGNTAVDRGGAIALYGSSAELTNCTLVGNSAHQGGGIAGGKIQLDHSTFIRNTAVDGGGIFAGIASGASSNGVVQVGAPGGPSFVAIDSCTFTGNSAQHRGGGLYLVGTYSPLVNSTISGNRAQQGGGLFLDASEPGFLAKIPQPGFGGTVFSGNIATATGGGVFINNGHLSVDGWTFTNNVARQGAALFNNLAQVTMTDSTVVKNRSQQGTQLFNHFGILSLTRSTVSDIARMVFLPTDNTSGTQFAAPNPGLEPTAVTPPAGNLIVTAADGIRYALTPDRLLLRQYPGGNWSILDDLVQNYKIAPNGAIYWLNDRGDLLRSQAGRAGDLIGQLVQSFAMDQNGTVYDLSTGDGPGNFAAYRSLTAPLLDPVVEVAAGEPVFCMTPPTGDEVVQALGLAGPAIQNLRIVVEPIVDRLDGLTYFPNIGLARMHHCHYKCTVYYDTEMNGSLEAVIYIDKDYLLREVPGHVAPSTLASQNNNVTTATAPIATAAIVTASDANRSDKIFSIWTGPDGTIYKLGGDHNGQHLVGTPPLPLVLWRLPPGGNWEPLLRVSAAEVAPDNTLFVLNTNHELQRLAPGASQWTTVASGVQSFTMTKDGTVYALDGSGNLIREQHARQGDQWVFSTLATGVQSFAVTADGVLYSLNNRNELQRFTGIGNRFVRIETGVTSLEQTADGTIYALNQAGQLKRLETRGRWSLLGTGIQSCELDADGVLYALNRQHELKRLTPGGHWSLVDADVQSFVLAPNGLRNVYILTTHQELKRLEAGYSWRTLRTDAVSVSIDSGGIVTARDTLGRSWMYWSPFTAPALDPVEGLVFCQDPPTRDDILRLLQIPDGPNVTVVVVEPTVDTLDPPRWFANLGNIPAVRLHHCQYQCTVQYTNAQGLQTVVIEIDTDHLIRWAGIII